MATVPLSGTDIRLLSGVPFANDYKNTMWFDSKSEQTTYFLNKNVVHSIDNANFQRIDGYYFIAVNKSIDDLWSTNYLMFQNASYNSKWFYGFVTRLEYKQKNVTYVHFQLDVFQTWLFEMNFKPSYVVREHCKLWNADGTPVINTVDEGLHYGTEYDTVASGQYVPYGDTFFMVVVAKKTMHGGSADQKEITPMLNGSPQPLTYYVHPFKMDGTSPSVSVDGQSVNISPLTDVLKSLYKQTDAVNNIVSLYFTDFIGFAGVSSLAFTSDILEHVTIQDDTNTFNTLYVQSLPSYGTLESNFGNKWSQYRSVKESKLLKYPYTQLILDDFKGNRVTYKNEYIQGNDLKIRVKGSLGVSNKVSYGIPDYNQDGSVKPLSEENALINNTPNDVPIITDLLSSFLQGNRNSLQVQKASIFYNGLMGSMSSGLNVGNSIVKRNPVGAMNGLTNGIQNVGNSWLELQGMQAKQQDIANVPPSIAKMGSNSAYDMGNGLNGVFIIKKQIKPEYQRKLEHFFNLYGYKLNEVKIPNFHTRKYWNYVQTANCTITGNINHEDLQELKSIFDNGVTLWHTDDVGNYSLENEVI